MRCGTVRVVSLLPSATEIVVALGHAGELVGRSHECDYPPSIRDRTVVMRPKVNDFERSSQEIDQRVRASRGRSESLYVLDTAALHRLRPDLLITQDLCGVCSVTGDEVTQACRTAGIEPRILSLSPQNLGMVWESIRQVGDALGDPGAAERLTGQLERRVRARPVTAGRPRVMVIEWLDPPIVAGLWVPDMVGAADGEPTGPSASSPGERMTWEAIGGARPDLVVISPCSFSVDRTRREIDHAGLSRTLESLHPSRGTWLADEAYFSRPGPRLADGVELLRSRLSHEPYTPPMPARPWIATEA